MTATLPNPELITGGSLRIAMSHEEWESLGETKHCEWSEGVLYVNSPTRWHIRAAMILGRRLDDVAPDGFCAYLEWGLQALLGDFRPDIMLGLTDLPDESYIAVPPILAVEIASPTTRDLDWDRKIRAYAQAGVAWYWIVDRAEITVFENVDGAFVERQLIKAGAPAVTVGPVALLLDPDTLTDR